jgi:OHCU decarboxylase
VTIVELDALPDDQARRVFASCCGVGAWVDEMLERRPFRDAETLLRAAEEVWWSLGPDEWREMFAHHPRIGERATGRSAEEQSGVTTAGVDVQAALTAGNREYEGRFGHIYLVSAAGKSADRLLAQLRARLSNDAATELRVAAGEQAKITRHRLSKLIGVAEVWR